MPSPIEFVTAESSREAGLLGGLSGLIAAGLVAVRAGEAGLEAGIAVGALTMLFYVVALVGLNLLRR